ncbi:MAG TPA: phenylalanine 4-monooxygenase [Caulobacteraceae bacterium]|jgi:phenylalanine-4-hydroxylase|nr:phenylalanine 4-monooxygenase [Caulobacteraceae bacterium]
MPATAIHAPTGAAEDWTVPQDWGRYTGAEHALWDRLFERQAIQLKDRAVPAFLNGLDVLHLSKPGIPDFAELSERLGRLTGWSVVAVPGLVPDEVFFEHLANRRFVAGRFIRKPEQIDYLQEPDVFHDLFGHVPLLADPVFADYMQAYGEGGLRAARLGAIDHLARLYWHTVEFGLIRTEAGLRIYGSGIVSSHGESAYALDDPAPPRIAFDMRRVMRTRYKIDAFQPAYFVIDSFEGLLKQTLETDFGPLYRALEGEPDIEPGAVVAGDLLIGETR